MAKHILITGFEPFGGENANPSEWIARNLDGRLLAGRLVVGRILPVETLGLRERLQGLVASVSPDAVICVGQALGRNALALEQTATNVLDFAQPDNAGLMRRKSSIAQGGPHERRTTLPLDAILRAWKEAGVPGYLSASAGTYVCNQALYELLRIAEDATPAFAAGFVHTPALPEQAVRAGAERTPSMSYALMERAMELLIQTVASWLDARICSHATAQ